MERDARYGAVGAFVVVVVAMATVFVLWYTNAQERRQYVRYEVYFEGSVSGLNEGSTVRYLGVNVGRVARIRIDPRDPKRVQVLIDVDAATPVNRETLARLSLQGVTGLLFIDLSQATPDMRGVLKDVPSERYAVIPSVPSDLDLFLSGLPTLVTQATYVTNRLNRLLSDDNLAMLAGTLESLRGTAAGLPETARQARQLIADLRSLTEETREEVASLHKATDAAAPNFEGAAQRLRDGAATLDATAKRLDALLARHEGDLDQFASRGLADFARLVKDGREAAVEVRALARSLHEDPSRVLYQPPSRGMEIPP